MPNKSTDGTHVPSHDVRWLRSAVSTGVGRLYYAMPYASTRSPCSGRRGTSTSAQLIRRGTHPDRTCRYASFVCVRPARVDPHATAASDVPHLDEIHPICSSLSSAGY